jgi:hypothetical protein
LGNDSGWDQDRGREAEMVVDVELQGIVGDSKA